MNGRDAAQRPRFGTSRLVAAIVLAATIVVVTAVPASAHAALVRTIPSAGAELLLAPKQVELTFGENVEISFGSIALYDQRGGHVDIGTPHHASSTDRSVEASLPRLGNGAYVVTWRVISADAHPVHGAFTFTIGSTKANAESLATKLLAQSGGSTTVGVLFAIARASVFAGIALLLGATAFAAAIRPHGRRRSRADALVFVGWILLFASTIAALLLQGPYAGALPLAEVFHPSVVRAVLHTRYGQLAMIRLALVLVAFPLLLRARASWRPSAAWWALAVPIGLAIAATPGLAGHAAAGTFTVLAVPIDALHVAAMSVWLGGLAALTLAILDHDPDARVAATHFSPVALTSVTVIVATGVFASWRQVGWSLDAFTSTTYGQLLLVKLGTFAVLLALAALSRRIVHPRRPATLSAMATETSTGPARVATAETEVRRLRWTVGGELVFGIAVLMMTALLVNAQPARSALALPFTKELRDPHLLVDVVVDPAKAGPTTIHVYTLTPAGTNAYILDITAQLSLASKGIPPITVPLVRAAPNHFRADQFVIPFAGKWSLTVRALRTRIDEVAVHTDVDIR